MPGNLMEEKRIDFSVPLLSMRRFTSTAASDAEESKSFEKFHPNRPSLPFYKAELKSGSLRNPGTVPFLWERIPGRRKDGSGLCQKWEQIPGMTKDGGEQCQNTPELASSAPKLPPGKIADAKQPSSAKATVDKEPEALLINKLTQADNLIKCDDVFSSNGNVTSSDRSKKDVRKERTPDLRDCDDDDFSDALDTLSHSESFFMNCSLSGLSSPDGPELKPSRSTSIDPQVQNFLMDRFLPAAKAMASETPQYATRKQPMARERVNLVRQVKNGDGDRRPLPSRGDKQPLCYQHEPCVTPHHSRSDEEDSIDDGENYVEADNLTVKARGMLPRLCLNNSLCLSNPVPLMKIRSQMLSSSIYHKATTHFKSTDPESLSEPNPETWEEVNKHKLSCGLQPPLASDDGSKPTSESDQLICGSDSQTPQGSSPYRPSSGNGIRPYRKEAPQSTLHQEIGFLGVPKQGKNCKSDGITMYGGGQNDDCRMLSHQSSKQGSGSLSPVTKETLDLYSVHMMETSNSMSSSSDIMDLMSSGENDSKLLLESGRFCRTLIPVDALGKPKQVKSFEERDSLHSNIFVTSESNSLSFSEGSILGQSLDNGQSFRQDDELVNRSSGFNMPEPLEEDEGNSYATSWQSPLPPPLPRSPSESWLCRTLPSISLMNPSSRSYLGVQFRSRKQLLKESPVYPKWETIVTTSKAQDSHVQFSEELKISASQASGK